MHCTLTQFNWTTRTHCTNTTYLLSLDTIQYTSTTLHMHNLLHLCTTICCSTNLLLCIICCTFTLLLCIDSVHNVDVPIRCIMCLEIKYVFIVHYWRFSTAWYGTVRHGSVRYGTAQFGSVAFPLQFSTAIEWAGLFTRRYNCAASTAVTSS